MAQANLVKLRLRLRIFLRKSEAIFSTFPSLEAKVNAKKAQLFLSQSAFPKG